MRYPVDVDREMRVNPLTHAMTGRKAERFRRLLEEVNAAFRAGVDGESGYPWDEELNITLAAEELGGMSGDEKRLMRQYIREINRAYLCGAGTREPQKTYPERLEDEIRACLEGSPKWCSPMELLRAAYDEIRRLNALQKV